MSASVLQISNDDERRFHVRLVRTHEPYGTEDATLHPEEEPVVEIFDATEVVIDDTPGYFTGIRCHAGTFFATAFEHGGEADTLFNESLPMWNILEDNLAEIRNWLKRQLSSQEQTNFIDTRPAVQPELPAEAPCAPPLKADPGDLQAALDSALNLLDHIEQLDTGWRQGDVRLRKHLLKAKKNLLNALSALHAQTSPPFEKGGPGGICQ